MYRNIRQTHIKSESYHIAVLHTFTCPRACLEATVLQRMSDVTAPFNDELFAACAGASISAVIALKSCNPIKFDSFSLGCIVLGCPRTLWAQRQAAQLHSLMHLRGLGSSPEGCAPHKNIEYVGDRIHTSLVCDEIIAPVALLLQLSVSSNGQALIWQTFRLEPPESQYICTFLSQPAPMVTGRRK